MPYPVFLSNPEPAGIVWMFGSDDISAVSYNVNESQFRSKKVYQVVNCKYVPGGLLAPSLVSVFCTLGDIVPQVLVK
jgi:hypothetical protein